MWSKMFWTTTTTWLRRSYFPLNCISCIITSKIEKRNNRKLNCDCWDVPQLVVMSINKIRKFYHEQQEKQWNYLARKGKWQTLFYTKKKVYSENFVIEKSEVVTQTHDKIIIRERESEPKINRNSILFY